MTSDLRVVIDTSVVVSAALLPRSVPRRAVDLALAHGRVLLSADTMAEIAEVLRRPKFDKYVALPASVWAKRQGSTRLD